MSENTGFSTDQLVIYKLGQIESQLNGISQELKKFVNDQADQDAKIEALAKRTSDIETTYKVDKAKVMTLAGSIGGLVAFIVALAKGILEKWIGLHSLS